MRKVISLALVSLVISLIAGTVYGKNWPQFRGEMASGLDDSIPLVTSWNVATGENVLWQVPMRGLAFASPIIWGDRIYVGTAIQLGSADRVAVQTPKDEKGNRKYLSSDQQSIGVEASHRWRLVALNKRSGEIIWDIVVKEGV